MTILNGDDSSITIQIWKNQYQLTGLALKDKTKGIHYLKLEDHEEWHRETWIDSEVSDGNA